MSCPICLNNKSSRYMITLECHHKICIQCSIEWLIKNPTCPLCRKDTIHFCRQTRSYYKAIQLYESTTETWNILFECLDGLQRFVGRLNESRNEVLFSFLKVFISFIEHYFLKSENYSLWYRPEMKQFKKSIFDICIDILNENYKNSFPDLNFLIIEKFVKW